VKQAVKPDLFAYGGQTVTVRVDRPLGSRHLNHEIWYTVNYGYIPGTVSGDGAPIDAYLLGVFEPVEEAEGVVIAVVARRDDVEDKLVVAPAGRTFTAEQVTALVEFQERFFDSEVILTAGLRLRRPASRRDRR
jgi:inorganic pyrophosphatase